MLSVLLSFITFIDAGNDIEKRTVFQRIMNLLPIALRSKDTFTFQDVKMM